MNISDGSTQMLFVGILVGTLAGLLIGYLIWARTKDSDAALGKLTWTMLIGTVITLICIFSKAPDLVTMGAMAMIPAEAVGAGIGKVSRDKS